MNQSDLSSILRPFRFLKRSRAFAFASALLVGLSSTHAQQTWDGGANDGVWNSVTNWSGNALPTSVLAVFDGTWGLSNNRALTVSAPASAAGISIRTTDDFSISGSTLTLSAGVSSTVTSGTTTFNSALSFGGNYTHTISNTVNFAGGIAGTSRNLTKAGTGTLILSASNVVGNLNVTAGALRLANSSAAGATLAGNNDITAGAAIEFDNNITVREEIRRLNGTGINNGGALRNISGTNTLTAFSDLLTASLVSSDAGLFNFTGADSAGTAFSGAFGLTFGGAGNISVSGVMIEITSLTKTGAGTLFLSGSNTFTGATTISNGVLRAANNQALGTVAGGVTVASGAALELSNNITIGAEGLALNGSGIGGTGALRNVHGTNTYGGAITNNTDAVIEADANTQLNLTNSITGTGLKTFDGPGNISATGVISGTNGVTKTGVGTLTLGNAANTYGGVTTIGGGVLRVGTLAAAGANSSIGTNATITITNGGVFDYTGATTNFNRGINLSSDQGGIGVSSNAAALTVSGVISNVGSLVKSGAGTLILSASNTYTGTTTISAGTLLLSNAGTISTNGLDLSASGATLNISNIAATTVDVASFTGATGSTVSLGSKNMSFGGNNASTTFAGAITGSGNLTKNGTGTTTLSGANTYTGSAIVSGGTLQLNNTTGSALGSITNVTVATNAVLLVAQSNQVNNSSSVSLSGGTIRTGTGVTETFGNLNVSSASFLDFGATFGNASSMNFGTYTPSSLLSIDNFNFGSTLTFKTDLTSSITNSSLFAFSNGGISSFNWNAGTSTFTITAIPEPSTVLAAAGLLGLMLWPSRRRILAAAKGLALRA